MFLTTHALPKEFEKKLVSAKRVDIASAWATFGPALDSLCAARKERRVKIRAMIGTFGNATDPDALVKLREIGKLCVIAGGKALFHPKVYIFWNDEKSSVWIGSANCTRAGFGRNEEAVYETGNYQEAAAWFEKRWKELGGPSPASAIDKYRIRRRRQGVSRAAAQLAGQPEQGQRSRAELLEGAGSWAEYVTALERCDELWADEGAYWTVLGEECSYVHTIEEGKRLAHRRSWLGLTDQERTILLGLRDGVDGVWGLLGSLIAAGDVKGVFNRSREAVNRRILNRVRNAVETVIDAPDESFPGIAVKALERIHREGGFNHGTATRLLALARPDRLISVNKGSRAGLAAAFDFKARKGTTLGRPKNYGLLLEKLYEKPWYCDQPGRSKQSRRLWSMRAALVDSFVYDPSA